MLTVTEGRMSNETSPFCERLGTRVSARPALSQPQARGPKELPQPCPHQAETLTLLAPTSPGYKSGCLVIVLKVTHTGPKDSRMMEEQVLSSNF